MSEKTIGVILSSLREATDKVAVVRAHVLAEAGTWQDPEVGTGLFEIQLAGIWGIGSSAETAVEDWIAQAERLVQGREDPAP